MRELHIADVFLHIAEANLHIATTNHAYSRCYRMFSVFLKLGEVLLDSLGELHPVIDVPQELVEIHPAFGVRGVVMISAGPDVNVELRSVFDNNTADDGREDAAVGVDIAEIFR